LNPHLDCNHSLDIEGNLHELSSSPISISDRHFICVSFYRHFKSLGSSIKLCRFSCFTTPVHTYIDSNSGKICSI